jgi:WD40 repeat protein
MASVRQDCALAPSLTQCAATALAADQPHAATPGLYDRPVLVIDPGMHTAPIKSASVDAEDRWAVTGSDDKTVRVWGLADGALLRTIRLPAGPGVIGHAYAVAMSPDGALVAAGGWTRWTEADPQDRIYLFDRASGSLVHPIDGLPAATNHLVFSSDGRRLAASLYSGGLRLYESDQGWTEVARDLAYGAQSYGASFAPDGRLATTGYDGKVRLYGRELKGAIRPDVTIDTSGGSQPYGIAFNLDGTQLAIGYGDSTAVTLLDGHTLADLPGPDTQGVTDGDLSKTAWSRDGRTLFAAGRDPAVDQMRIFAWSDSLVGRPRTLATSRNTVTGLFPLRGGDLLIAAADPWLGRLRADGMVAWKHEPKNADYRSHSHVLRVSSDGALVDFSVQAFGKAPAEFDIAARVLTPNPPHRGTAAPRLCGLKINLENAQRPTLDGQQLGLHAQETSRSFAIHPAGDRFVLGAEWTLRAFDSKGVPLWTCKTPGVAWGVNITGDCRLVVAAYGDGTIRWHRMSDGVELLAFAPLSDLSDWVAWTPEGFYFATLGAQGILRWHVNHGRDAPADSVAIEDIPGSFRWAVLPLVLQELETPRALGLAVLAEHKSEVAIRTYSKLPDGVQLHLLTIGISDYNEDYAKHLRLRYAKQDAEDLAKALENTQEGLYSRVDVQTLRDKDASKRGILRGLHTLQMQMERGSGDDLAVVHFSGHGTMVKHTLYLLPEDTDARDDVGIKETALSIDALKTELLDLAKHGRVLVLLDACHSGSTTLDGSSEAVDAAALRHGLAAANVTVLTSSGGSEASLEDEAWQHGAFTRALLDALSDPAADVYHTGLINPNALAQYVASRVRSLTGGKQAPDMEVRSYANVFAVRR